MTNRFKRLDLIDRVPEELWTEVCDTVQEAGIKLATLTVKTCIPNHWTAREFPEKAK